MKIKQSYEVDPKGHFLRYAWFENPHVRQYTAVFSSLQALKFRLWESASFPLICMLGSGQSPHRMRCGINPCRACPCASNKSVGEPNTPLAFRRRVECHTKQQAGHGKIIVSIGQDTEKPISRVADYDTSIFPITPKKDSQDFNPVAMIWENSYGRRKNTSSKTRINQRYLSAISPTKTPDPFDRNIGQSNALPIGYAVDFVSPILSQFIMSIAKLAIRIKLLMSNAHTTSSPTKIGLCYGRLLSWALANEIS